MRLASGIGDNKERSARGSFYTTARRSGAFSDAAIIAVPYSGVWGDRDPRGRLKIDLEAQIEPIVVDGIGTVVYGDRRLPRATCRPWT